MNKPDELYPPFLPKFEDRETEPKSASMMLHEARWRETFLTYVVLDLTNVWYKRAWRRIRGGKTWKNFRDVEILLEKYLQKTKDRGDF